MMPSNKRRLLLLAALVLVTASPAAHAALEPEPSPAGNNGTDDDRSALLAFKSGLSDPLGVLRHNWTTGASVCDWVGVSCGSGRVTALSLPDVPLQGAVAPSLGNLSFLSVLNLTNASLTGRIPAALGRLGRRLLYLNLNQNSLSGSIPAAVGNLTSLQVLDLHHNQISGGIPVELRQLRSLRFIRLDTNGLSGPIPGSMFNDTPLLSVINLGNNSLSGPVPASVGSLSRLTTFVLQGNRLSGPLPASIFNKSMLQVIALAENNNLTGPIPDNGSFNLPMLEILSTSRNEFSGKIPSGLAACRFLRILSLSYNFFDDVIPAWLPTLSQLTLVSLGGNNLVGQIPAGLSNLTNLNQLDLVQSKLSGGIPAELGRLGQLSWLNLAANKLSGYIPASLGNLSMLNNLGLAYNQLQGTVPLSLGHLTSLQTFNVESNNLKGDLGFLDALSNCRSLQFLDISLNSFTGSIPDGPAMVNNLSSSIPTTLWHLENLIELDLSLNSLSGTLPVDIGSMQAIVQVDLSTNHLSGAIPISLGQLQTLTYLNLSHNMFQDSIPDSLGKLTSIATLDLSHNSLSGTIPSSLANLTYLRGLNLSFNKLQGQIPTGGIFSTIGYGSLVGNAALCGLPHLGFSPCESDSSRSTKLHILRYVLPITVTFVVSIIVLSLLLLRAKFKKPKEGTTRPPMVDGTNNHMVVSYHEIVRATGNFSGENLIGVGSFGKVFRGQLNDGLMVAIKVLNLESERASKSFDVECQALRMARHRNLVKIISTCSNNLDFKALVLQYMRNGSLEALLHAEGRTRLGFLKRFDIMLDVAMALEYLHHHHFDVILHCDLKPSNVLLDEEFTGHLADFGIAKLLLGDDTSIISASMPGTIGYMAPEYGSIGKASRKSDVFSYGIMLLEVFTRRRPTDPMFGSELSLRQWVQDAAFRAQLAEVIDPDLLQGEKAYGLGDILAPESTSNTLNSCLVSIVQLGLLCSSESPDTRIPMNEVVNRLNKIRTDYSSQRQYTYCSHTVIAT
ncbi:hypothetical protein BS78_02G049800 [Paspalum vaginatum]|nr:hypothetical protein BS78_02G049800 [Paspalum vaginatum]